MDPDEITFDITLRVELGVKPMEDIVKIWTYEREGTALALTVGHKVYGKYRWNITNHSVDIAHTDKEGDPTAATVSVTLHMRRLSRRRSAQPVRSGFLSSLLPALLFRSGC